MAARQKPLGSVVRNPPDWFAHNMMGGGGSNGPCVGNRDAVGVYNNASDGTVLRVYGINYNTGASIQLWFKMIQGTVGIIVPDGITATPINPRTPAQFGQIWRYSTAAGQGIAIGGVISFANIDYDLNPGYPLAIVPPGYMYALEPQTTNTAINAYFRFLPAYD